ncbi:MULTISPECIES: hypothetical protein [unclassified Neisseria]|uniref:hypothetical protein n=1 Tax=unclassified Neisseria TaxID=2623750 RepID=UPI002665E51B|nr:MULTISPECIES: hypothetical protein [unclassified Neisseria]MDO1509966.1 hypothetical protein [Neisseria sp. MVDL19-042950]MDO1516166.1 hypothetical protein [Neisseria sp. MVDL18-041461]MDO1563281.1 hypothetical protein [Neisseria sp. MVDL20-010259]
MMNNVKSAKSAWAAGFVSSFCLFPSASKTPSRPVRRSDRQALAQDWQKIGSDFKKALEKVSESL